MMKFNADDPRLTAFALGELDAEEAAPIERALSESPSLKREIEQIRAMAGSVKTALSAEASPRLTPAQRETIAQEPQWVLNSPLIFRRSSRWIAAGAALAACIALAITAAIMFNSTVNTDNNTLAIHDQNKAEMESARVKQHLKDRTGPIVGQPAPESLMGKSAQRQSAASSEHFLESRREQKSLGRSDAAIVPQSPPAGIAGSSPETGGRRARSISPKSSSAAPPPPPAEPYAIEEGRSQDRMQRSAGSDLDGIDGSTLSTDELRDAAADDKQGLAKNRAELDIANEGLAVIEDNSFQPAIDDPLSTFSIDVDTASYANVRRFINQGMLPPRDAVRIEELVNYFSYDYEPPSAADGDAPFSANVEVNIAPWNPVNRLVRIGLKGKEVKLDMRPPTSLVFLIDVSGSMSNANKLPLVKESLTLLVDQLNGDDRLAIVTYAGQAGLLLDSMYVTGENKPRILQAIASLSAGGSTNGAGGIGIAYDTAVKHFIKGGVNRVILCTDGDFNVGVSSNSELVQLIQQKRDTGVFLSVLGFGTGNFKEDKMQDFAKHGNGNFAYIDSIDEGRKVLVEKMGGTLITIAKDVKIQVDFNPKKVGSYRLIGYENRLLAAQDFRDDKKDAGEIGSGHTVTALYEITPPDADLKEAQTSPQSDFVAPMIVGESELLMKLKVRYKQPDGDQSAEQVFPIADEARVWNRASADFKLAASVAAFGMILRDSPYKGDANFTNVLNWASDASAGMAATGEHKAVINSDQDDVSRNDREEFMQLVERANEISQRD